MPEITRDKFGTGILSKSKFAAQAIARVSPFLVADQAAADALPEDLRLAIDAVSSREHSIVSDRKTRMAVLSSIASDLAPLRTALDRCKCDTAQQVAGSFNAAWSAAVIDAMGWKDTDLPLRYLIGFPVVFDIPDSGVFKADWQPASIPPEEFAASNTRMVAQIVSEIEKSAAQPQNAERRKQCWKKTKAEIKAGLVFGPYKRGRMDRRYGRGKWRCMGRNAIEQKDQWRCIDNAKRNKANKAQTLHERITCGRADFPATISREFARRQRAKTAARAIGSSNRCGRAAGIRKRRTLRMKHGTMDLKAAYRRVPTSQPEYTNVAVWNDDSKAVEFCDVPGHNFGLASAVINFNRYPELAVSAARRLLWVVTEHYYDDADTAEPSWAQGSGQACLYALCGDEFFGFGFDDEQTAPMEAANDYLGVNSDLSHMDDGYIQMDVSRKRREKIKLLVSAAVDNDEMRSGLAASVFGKARFMISPCYGGLGNACLPPINLRSRQKGAVHLSGDLRDSLEFIAFACDYLPPMQLSVLPMTTQKVVVFVDAEGKKRKGARPPTGHLGFVIYHPVFGTVHAHREVPPALVALLDAIKQRETYIGQFELLGAIAPFVSMPRSWFAGYPVELWIDNSGAMSALIKDYSGLPDCSRLVNMFHFAIARLGLASLWIDYVASESNPADVPSRAHELGERAANELAEFGRLVDLIIPAFASEDGEWLSFVEIARSVW